MKTRFNLLFGLFALLLISAVQSATAQFNCTTNDGSITITGYTGLGGVVTIPGTFNGLPVTSIGTNAFSGIGSIETVTIPNSVTNIAYGAFSDDYTALVEGGPPVWGLTSVTIGSGVVSIGDYAFANCELLASITIPNTVTNLGSYAFDDCFSLANVAIGNGVTSIESYAFDDCISLTNASIGNGATNIGSYAFYNCTGLNSVTVGSSVANIGSDALAGSTALEAVYFLGNAPSLGSPVFGFPDRNAIVYYLPGTQNWGTTFGNRLPTVLWNPRLNAVGSSFGVQNNQFGFNITSSNNLTVVVQACTNLASQLWEPVQTITITGSPSYFSDPQWTNYPARFYRLTMP